VVSTRRCSSPVAAFSLWASDGNRGSLMVLTM